MRLHASLPLLLAVAAVAQQGQPVVGQPAVGQPAVGQPGVGQPGMADAPLGTLQQARAGIDRALDFLVTTQNHDGTWGSQSCETTMEMSFSIETHYAWGVAANALATMTLLAAPETPARRAALDKAVRWLCNCHMTMRGSAWDNDAVWGWLYGTVAMTAIADDRRFGTDDWRAPVAHRGREFAGWLEKNQEPLGGFGYYDDPIFTRRPKWGTSFSTAAVAPALGRAAQLGWLPDTATHDRAVEYIRRCRLPNGAYEYDLNPVPRLTGGPNINDVKGSLGRIQACNWALSMAADPGITTNLVRQGLEQFFEQHRFLTIARMRPIPHEAYYQNAGYFYFFGHYYGALAIELLPAAEREPFRAQLRQKVLETQRADGSYCDFLGSSYMVTACTGFATLGLLAGMPPSPPSNSQRR